jgi:glycosyltransferase involved in cell wall biosynthesis
LCLVSNGALGYEANTAGVGSRVRRQKIDGQDIETLEDVNLTVLFLSNRLQQTSNHLHVTGQEPDPRLLVDGLAAMGIKVKERKLNRFPINPLARFGTFYAGFDIVRAICVLLLDRRVDMVVSIGESNIAIILLLRAITRFKPVIVLREISARGWRRRDRIVDFVVPRVDRVLALTRHQTSWAEQNFRLKAAPAIVGFAIDEAFYKPQNARECSTILAVGDDVGRDYACLIAAFGDMPYKLVLRTDQGLAIPEGMRDRVTLLGRLSGVALRDLYAAASIVVVPLHQVDHPSGITALFEAMAMGRPVVASDTGSTRDFVQHGGNGILVPVGEPAAMRAALVRLMGDAELRRRLGQNARETIEAHFSFDAYVRRFAESLRSVAASARRYTPSNPPQTSNIRA